MRLFVVISLVFISFCNAQSRYQIGSIKVININKSLKKDWKLNLKSETRSLYANSFFKESKPIQFDYQFTDAALLASKKVGLSNQLAFGFQLRFTEETEKRFTQQFNIVTDYYSFKLAHRFTTDQTLVPEEDTNYRFRYRFSYSKPFSGNELNAREWYLKIGNEYVNSFKGNLYDLEIRLTPAIGYNFAGNSKLEFALEYRINGFVNLSNRHRGFLVVNYYVSI